MLKTIATLISAAVLLMLTGCATVAEVGQAVNCNAEVVARLKSDNDYLVERRKVIEGYESGAIPIPGMVFSFLSRADVVAAHKSSYNRMFDMHLMHSDRYNRICVKKSPA